MLCHILCQSLLADWGPGSSVLTENTNSSEFTILGKWEHIYYIHVCTQIRHEQGNNYLSDRKNKNKLDTKKNKNT